MKLMSKFGDDDNAILYCAQETVRKGWKRDLLLNAIKMKVHENQPAAIDNNFEKALSATQAAYANEVFRSSYNLGFLGVTEPIAELAPRQPLYKEKPRILTKFLQKASGAQALSDEKSRALQRSYLYLRSSTES